MDASAPSNLIQDLRRRLQHTVECRSIVPVFQPIVDLQAGRISGFESLSRPGPECDFSDATELFESAEKGGMLWDVEEVARQHALHAATGWPDGTQLFLNSSPEVFADPRFARQIIQGIESIPGLTPDRVVLEITEQASEQSVGGLERQVELLKDYGFHIAIDDVGAGRSGLNRIVTLRPSWLKLNRVLVDMVDQDRARQNLIRFFLHFARLSGVSLIAEGIERPEELWTLVDLGVQFGQGFYLGRPGARDQVLNPTLADALRRKSTIRPRAANVGGLVQIQQYASTVPVVSPRAPIATVLTAIGQSPNQPPGCIVADGQRVVGWCSAESLHRLTWDHATEVGFACRTDACVARPDDTVGDALALTSSRNDFVPLPLILADESGIAGIVSPRALLAAASDITTMHTRRVTPLTGLPNRVMCDQHMHDRLSMVRDSHVAAGCGDLAIIDVRGMSEFNGVYGFELGDQLIEQVATLIRRIIVQPGDAGRDTPIFLGHLGDDRFLVTCESNVLPRRCMRMLKAFSRRGVGPIGHTSDNSAMEIGSDLTLLLSPAEHLGLRCILLQGALNTCREIREVHALADAARRQPRESQGRIEVGSSELIVTAGLDRLGSLRRAG
jgi:EAL domain-containing protein (putative c-di-GMP-specific phosphodiesterase class I)/GGDEF domain-containing protein